MKRATKKGLWIAFLCIGLGTSLMITALAINGFRWETFQTEQMTKREIVVEEAFTKIRLLSADEAIEVVPSTDDVCRVVCYDSEHIAHRVYVRDNCLETEQIDARGWYDKIGVFFGPSPTVRVYLPDASYKSIKARTGSGSIRVSDGILFESVQLVSESGSIALSGAIGSETLTLPYSGDVQTKSGGITVHALTGGTLRIVSSSGSIRCDELASEQIEIYTESGSMQLENVYAERGLVLQANSGSIRFAHTDAPTIAIMTESGSVRGTLKTGKRFQTATQSGSVIVPADAATDAVCSVRTGSGSIRIEIEP